jgi:xanthine/uracil permease
VVVLLTILLVNRYGSPLLRNMAVLVGMLVGAGLAYGLGMGNFHSVEEAPWLTVPYPFYFGLPTFSLIPIATMVVVMIVQMVESMGLFVAIGDIVDKPVEDQQVVNGCAPMAWPAPSPECSPHSRLSPSWRTSVW